MNSPQKSKRRELFPTHSIRPTLRYAKPDKDIYNYTPTAFMNTEEKLKY